MEKPNLSFNQITNNIYSNERALYGEKDLNLISCRFEGDEDGESALKECENISISDCCFSLRYPLWHNKKIYIVNSLFKDTCRAPIWYSRDIVLKNTNMSSPKSFRECSNINITDSTINSAEVFWKCANVTIHNSNITGEYMFLNTDAMNINTSTFNGKYSFQYIHDVKISDCKLYTKDAFWHSKNVTVKNSIIEGEYLGWYSKNLTLINCHIKGTQPLCYCNGLKIIDCTFEDADLAFENSEVDASIIGSMISIKNPLAGRIVVDNANIIYDEQNKYFGNCEIILKNKEGK